MGIFFKKKKSLTDPSKVLENGWQFCTKPTEFDKPGTIFRIDRDDIRYEVAEVPIEIKKGAEVFGNSTQTRHLGIGIISRIFGITGFTANLNLNFNTDFELTFCMNNVVHEQTNDKDIDNVLPNFREKINYRADNRYFFIREARKCKGMTYFLTDGQVSQLGGDINIEKGLSFNGNLYKMDKKNGYQLTGDFQKYLRVMFLVEEIMPIANNLNSDDVIFGRAKVQRPLDWK
jgi:hypothetical protein